jgi:hypothetical protein
MLIPSKCMASDKQRTSQEYWEQRLKRMGLTPRAGEHKWLSYGHKLSALDYDGVRTYATAEDVEENQEWPISL